MRICHQSVIISVTTKLINTGQRPLVGSPNVVNKQTLGLVRISFKTTVHDNEWEIRLYEGYVIDKIEIL